jgi:hypothetical protein
VGDDVDGEAVLDELLVQGLEGDPHVVGVEEREALVGHVLVLLRDLRQLHHARLA